MPAQYPSFNDRQFDLIKKLVNNSAELADGTGIPLTVAEANLLYFRLDGANYTSLELRTRAALETTTTDNAISRYDGTEGETQDSVVTVADTTGRLGVPAGWGVDAAGAIDFQAGGANSDISVTPTGTGVFKSNTGYSALANTTAYAASTAVDLTKNLQTVTLAGNITFTTSNKSAGLYTTVRVIGDGSNRALSFPGTWVWVGSVAPATLIANKVGLLSLVCFGAADSDVVASWVSSL